MSRSFFQPDAVLTMQNAKAVLAEGLAALQAGQTEFDLGRLTQVDSAAVATLLAWRRAARDAGGSLVFKNLPSSLESLANLYGVSDLLQASAPRSAPTTAPA